jgi:phospholipid/cholesterol/gamma-HCH transport system substrate-binding protein
METNIRYTVVGAFVIILMTAIVIAIIWLSSGFSFEEYKTYKIYMKESVSGLNPESSVEFNGVDVGNITNMEINQKNPRIVEVWIDVKKNTPITVDTFATLSIRGITGLAYIALQDKGTNVTPLVETPGEQYPVIKTAPSILVRMDIAMTKLSESLQQMSVSLQALLSKENLAMVKKILNNSATASQQLQPLIQNSISTISNAGATSREITNTARTISEMTDEIKQNPSILIRGKEPQPLGPGEK